MTRNTNPNAPGKEAELICGEFSLVEKDASGRTKVTGRPEQPHLYEVTASDDEVTLIVCYATSTEKALSLAQEWADRMEGVACYMEFRMSVIDIDRIGFDDDIIVHDTVDITDKLCLPEDE